MQSASREKGENHSVASAKKIGGRFSPNFESSSFPIQNHVAPAWRICCPTMIWTQNNRTRTGRSFWHQTVPATKPASRPSKAAHQASTSTTLSLPKETDKTLRSKLFFARAVCVCATSTKCALVGCAADWRDPLLPQVPTMSCELRASVRTALGPN